jgi:hypothetical protein
MMTESDYERVKREWRKLQRDYRHLEKIHDAEARDLENCLDENEKLKRLLEEK